MIERLREKYAALGERDRRAVKLVLLCLPVLIYLLLLEPLYAFYHNQRLAYESNTELVGWMQQNKDRLAGRENASAPGPEAKDLIQLVTTSAEDRNIAFDRIQPDGGHRVRLYARETAFEPLLRWLSGVREQGIAIDSVRLESTSKPGYVNFRGTLSVSR